MPREPRAGCSKLDRALLAAAAWQKRQLAHDLHEGVCQTLAGISLLLGTLLRHARAGKPADVAEMERIARYLDDAIDQSRAPFRAQALTMEPGGLVEVLGGLARSTAKTIACEFRPPGKMDRPAGHAAFALYLIAHEAVRNALRYSQAGKITISLFANGRRTALEIHDDGTGLAEVSAASKGKGLGLMRHFARAIDARLAVESAPGRGTTVRCTLPGEDAARPSRLKREKKGATPCLKKRPKSGLRKSPRPATQWT